MFNIRFPVVRENIRVSHKNIREEMEGLIKSRKTGFAMLQTSAARFYFFMESGHPVGGGVEAEQGRRLESPSVLLDQMEKSLRMETGKLSVFQVPNDLLHILLGYFASKRISENLPGELLDLKAMLAKLSNANFTGFVWGQGKNDVVAFMSFGEIVGIFVNGKESTLKEANQAIKSCLVSVHNTERAIEVESVIFSREHKARIMEEAYRLVLEIAEDKTGLELVLREALMVESEKCPFLNPFLGLVDIKSGRLRVDPAVDPDELSQSFFKALITGVRAYFSDDAKKMRQAITGVAQKASEAGVSL